MARRAFFFLGLAFLGGCSAILGFEDTTLVSGAIDGGDDGTTPGDDGGNGADAATGRLTAKPAAIVVRRAQTAQVTVTLDRGTDIQGPVSVTLTDLPAGITATKADLADGVSTGTISIVAAKTAVLGPATIHMALTNKAVAPVPVSLLVADAPGALDVTFDSDGVLLDATRGVGATYFALAPQPDGKLLAGGTAQPQGWMLRRFGAAGAPDATFSVIGIPVDGELRGLTLDAAGNVYAIGSSTNGIFQELTVVKLGPTGTIDVKFGTNGIFRLSNVDAPQGSSGYAIALQPDGMIVAAGALKVAGGEDGLVVRLKTDGTKDAAFAGGVVTVKKNHFVGVSVDPGGNITFAGTDTTGTPSFFLGRRTTAGAIDATFGTAGALSFGTTFTAQGFARLPDGSLAVVGSGANQYTGGVASSAGAQQWVRAAAIVTNASFYATAAQADGSIIAAGHSTGATSEARVMRLAAKDGTADQSFGANGTTIISQRPAQAFDSTLFAAAVQPDGRIVVSGNRSNAGAAIYRLWP